VESDDKLNKLAVCRNRLLETEPNSTLFPSANSKTQK
jgi:hypothetical protein